MHFRSLHSWDLSYQEAVFIQKELAKKVKLKNHFSKIYTIAGADIAIQSQTNEGFAGVVLFSFPDLKIIEQKWAREKIRYPYIPGLLSFRESPLLLSAFRKLRLEPDLIMIDGQGIAHPRRLGIASHIGLILNKPTIGCAKSLLIGNYQEPKATRGSSSILSYKGKRIGTVVRTRNQVKPVFISPGHKIDFETSVKIVLKCCDGYRIPKPTREADLYVERLKRNSCNLKSRVPS